MGFKRPKRGTLLLISAILGLGCATSAPQPDPGQLSRRATARLEIGVDHLRNGREALALRDFQQAESLDPRNVRIQLALGEGYLVSGRLQQSERHFRRALELDSREFDARMHLTAILIHSKRYREALAECRFLVQDPTFPSPWRALSNCGQAHLELGELGDARKSLEQALDYRVDFWPATLSLGILAHRQGRRHEALEHFQDVLARDPGATVKSEVHYRLGELYVSLGQRPEALTHLARSVAEAPRGFWARQSEAYLEQIQ